jgi:hypothetical protein
MGLKYLAVIGALVAGFMFIPGWTMLLGTISVVLAIVAIRKRGAGGKTLTVIALVLGALQITGAGLRLLQVTEGIWHVYI